MKQHILNAFLKILKITDDDSRNKVIETRADTLALPGFKNPFSRGYSNKKREAKEET